MAELGSWLPPAVHSEQFASPPQIETRNNFLSRILIDCGWDNPAAADDYPLEAGLKTSKSQWDWGPGQWQS